MMLVIKATTTTTMTTTISNPTTIDRAIIKFLKLQVL